MDTLLSENANVQEWCDDIIRKQEATQYTSLTSDRDMNHIVKENVQLILEYLKSQGQTEMKFVSGNCKEALSILLPYLRKHEVWKPSKTSPLRDDELEKAFEDLYIDTYAKVDRKFKDPQLNGQNYALFSFQPTKESQPGPDGLYGFIKVRGTFDRLEEAEEKSKELIQYFSANKIYVCKVGLPTPLTIKEDVIGRENIVEVSNPDKKDKDAVTYEELIKEQSLQEKQQIEEIKQREQLLKDDVAKDPEEAKDPFQAYMTKRNERATAIWMYNDLKKKMEASKAIILRCREVINDMDKTNPTFKEEAMTHYKKTCEECGIDKATDDMAIMIRECFGEEPDNLGF